MIAQLPTVEQILNENRIYHFNGEITEESTSKLLKVIAAYNVYDLEQSKILRDYKSMPITIYLSTYGGDANCTISLYDSIRTSSTPIIIIVSGYCMSGGFYFINAAHKVIALSNTRFMYHELSRGCFGKLNELKDDIDEDIKLQAILDKMITDNTKIKKQKLKSIQSKKIDWYISAKEALEFGLIDEIVG